MRKGTLKKKVNGQGKVETEAEKKHTEEDGNGSLISDDESNDGKDSPKKDAVEDSDGSKKSDDNDESLADVARSKKIKKKITPKETKAKKSKSKPETEYEVDKVVGMKEKKGQKLYQIRWKGYDKDGDTWEPESELSCPAKIQAYLDSIADSEADWKEEEEEEPKAKKDKSKKKSEAKSGKKRKGEVKKAGRAKRAKSESDSDGEEVTKEYEVEKIIEVHHKKNGKREFLVRWKGYSSKEDTWEPEEHLECPELISKFEAKVEKAKAVGERSLRVNPTHTEPYTLSPQANSRRLSRRGDGKQRARYYEAE